MGLTAHEAIGLTKAQWDAAAQVEAAQPVLTKLEAYVAHAEESRETAANKLADLAAEGEAARINFDSQYAELEKRAMTSDERARSKSELYTRLLTKQQVTETELAAAREAASASKAALITCEGQLGQAEAEKKNLTESIRKLKEDMLQLQQDLDTERESAKKARTAKLAADKQADEAIRSTEELNRSLLQAQRDATRVSSEAKAAKEQQAYYSSELDSVREEARNTRRSLMAELQAARQAVDEKTDEASSLAVKCSNAQEDVASLKGRVADLEQKVESEQNERLQSEKLAKQELETKAKLCKLYESEVEDKKARITELASAIEGLHAMKAEAVSETAQKLMEAESALSDTTERCTAAEALAEKLEIELRNANVLLGQKSRTPGDPAAMFPNASELGARIKHGMTLTEIYTELCTSEDKRTLAEARAERVEQDLQEILKQIEERGPELMRQREELEEANGKITDLTTRLQQANSEFRAQDNTIRQQQGTLSLLQRQNRSLEGSIADVSRQLQELLRVNTELRTGRPVPSTSSGASSGADAEGVIDIHLVTVSGIEDLQTQNVALRASLRELSEQREAEELVRLGQIESEMQSKLDESAAQITKLIEQQKQQAEAVKVIVQQRDSWKLMAERASPNKASLRGTNDVIMTPSGSGGDARQNFEGLADAQVLADLRDSFEKYKADRAVNDRMVLEDQDRIRAEYDAKRMECVQLATRLESAVQRHTDLQRTVDGLMKERGLLSQRISEYSKSAAKYDTKLRDLTAELDDARGQLRRAQAMVESTKNEKETLSTTIARLEQENSAAIAERKNQSVLFSSLQSIIEGMKSEQGERVKSLTREVEDARSEVKQVRQQMVEEQDAMKTSRFKLESEAATLREDLSKEHKAHGAAREERIKLLANLEKVQEENGKLSSDLDVAKRSLTALMSGKADSGDSAAEDKDELINKLRVEKAELEKKVSDAMARIDQYKAIASTAEEQLADLHKNQDALSANLKSQMEKHEAAEEALRKACADEEAKAEQVRKDLAALQNVLDEHGRAAKNAAIKAETELADLRAAAETAQQAQSVAEQDCEKHKQLAIESRDNYDREHTLHNATMAELSVAKETRDKLQAEAQARVAEKETAEAALDTLRASIEEQKALMQEQTKSLEKELESEREHNKNLLAVVSELESVQKSRTADAQQPVTESGTDGEVSTETTTAELLQVVRYEKHAADLARAKTEEAKVQLLTIEQRCNFLERQLGDAQKALHKERERAQNQVQTSTEHAELLKKVETLNLLHESNTHLRDEKQRLENLYNEALAKIKNLEDDITPVREKVRELEISQRELLADKMAAQAQENRWKERAQQIHNQFKEINPEEFESLKKEKEKFEESKREAVLKAQQETADHKDKVKKLQDLGRKLQKERNEAQTERDNGKKQIVELETKLASLASKPAADASATAAQIAKVTDELKAVRAKATSEGKTLKAEVEKLKTELTGLQAQYKAMEERKTHELEEMEKRKNKALEDRKKLYEKLKALKAQEKGGAAQSQSATTAATPKPVSTEKATPSAAKPKPIAIKPKVTSPAASTTKAPAKKAATVKKTTTQSKAVKPAATAAAAAAVNPAEEMRLRLAKKMAAAKEAKPAEEAASSRKRALSDDTQDVSAVGHATEEAASAAAVEETRAAKRARALEEEPAAAAEVDDAESAVPEVEESMATDEGEVPTVDGDDPDETAADVYDDGAVEDADEGPEDGDDDGDGGVAEITEAEGSVNVPDIEQDTEEPSEDQSSTAQSHRGISRASRPGGLGATVPDLAADNDGAQVPSTPVLGGTVVPSGQQVPTRSKSSLNNSTTSGPFSDGVDATADEVLSADVPELDDEPAGTAAELDEESAEVPETEDGEADPVDDEGEGMEADEVPEEEDAAFDAEGDAEEDDDDGGVEEAGEPSTADALEDEDLMESEEPSSAAATAAVEDAAPAPEKADEVPEEDDMDEAGPSEPSADAPSSSSAAPTRAASAATPAGGPGRKKSNKPKPITFKSDSKRKASDSAAGDESAEKKKKKAATPAAAGGRAGGGGGRGRTPRSRGRGRGKKAPNAP